MDHLNSLPIHMLNYCCSLRNKIYHFKTNLSKHFPFIKRIYSQLLFQTCFIINILKTYFITQYKIRNLFSWKRAAANVILVILLRQWLFKVVWANLKHTDTIISFTHTPEYS